MRTRRWFAIGLALALVAPCATTRGDEPARLHKKAFEPLPLGSIKPRGWLKAELGIQASGLSGHLDEFWPDIKNSAWTGGTAEGWERAPYWLDGIVPLGVLLDDQAIQAKAKRFIDYVLDHPQADGWLGPVTDGKHPVHDPWPLYVLFKALIQYQEATHDSRVIPAILKCARRIDQVISEKPLSSWAQFRAADFAISLDWLYEQTHEDWLLALGRKVLKQGYDWVGLYDAFPFRDRVLGKFEMNNHGVNTAMGLKYGGVRYRFNSTESDRDAVDRMLDQLDRYHGQATGIFTCDEHLGGRSPSQGTELCTVVEAMFSLEVLLSLVGEPALGDRLERLTFNALPATFKPDMTAHQYDQQANQVLCKVSPDHVYGNNGPDANLFGVEPNFGCCTANMHQGWPKFAANLWMRSPDGGLAAMAYAPCSVRTKIDEQEIGVEVATEYPFRDRITITVKTASPGKFPIHLRIPAWAAEATVQLPSGARIEVKSGSFHKLDREWKDGDTIVLRLPMTVRLWQGYHNSVAIERGPLVFSLRVGEHWKQLRGKLPFADWEVFPTTPWNYALKVDRERPERSVRFEERPVGDRPFSQQGAPIVAHVQGRAVPWWTLERNAAAPPPASPVHSEQPLTELELVPYGCTGLRVSEFPTLDDR